MESIDLFEEKYVRFMPDDELLGKECFVDNFIFTLKDIVNFKDTKPVEITGIEWTHDKPFITRDESGKESFLNWTFAYYDPYLEIKRAFYYEDRIIQAYFDGKWRNLVPKKDAENIISTAYDNGIKLRILPKIEIYRPFENAKELVSLWESRYNPSSKQRCSNSMPLIWIENKTSGKISFITDYISRGVCTSLSSETWKDLYENWTFLDGKPCGKKTEEEE